MAYRLTRFNGKNPEGMIFTAQSMTRFTTKKTVLVPNVLLKKIGSNTPSNIMKYHVSRLGGSSKAVKGSKQEGIGVVYVAEELVLRP